MSVNIHLDTKEFQETMRKYLAVTSRTLPEALNQKMFYIARGASRLTPTTSRQAIEQELGVVGYRTPLTKKGERLKAQGVPGVLLPGIKGAVSKSNRNRKSVKNAITGAGAIVYRIINARLGRSGKKGLHGADMKAAVSKLLAKRFRSVGTLKAGWLGAIRLLGRVIGESPREDARGASSIIKGKSKATPAREGFNPSVSLEYNTNSFERGHRAYIDKRVNAALSQAFNDEARSMEQYVINKLQKTIDAVPTRKPGATTAEAAAFIRRLTKV